MEIVLKNLVCFVNQVILSFVGIENDSIFRREILLSSFEVSHCKDKTLTQFSPIDYQIKIYTNGITQTFLVWCYCNLTIRVHMNTSNSINCSTESIVIIIGGGF